LEEAPSQPPQVSSQFSHHAVHIAALLYILPLGEQALVMVWSNFFADCPVGGAVALAGSCCLLGGIRLELHRHCAPCVH